MNKQGVRYWTFLNKESFKKVDEIFYIIKMSRNIKTRNIVQKGAVHNKNVFF